MKVDAGYVLARSIAMLNVSLTIEKLAHACSRSPTSPASVKYFPVQMPSSSGETTSSDTADSSRMLEEMLYGRNDHFVKVIPQYTLEKDNIMAWFNLISLPGN